MNSSPVSLSCETVRKQLFSYHEGLLSEGMGNALATHLLICEGCNVISQQVAQVLEEINKDRQIPEHPFFFIHLLAKQQLASATPRNPSLFLHFTVLKPLVISFTIFAGLLVGILIGNTGIREISGISQKKTTRSEALKVYADEVLVSEFADAATDRLLVLK